MDTSLSVSELTNLWNTYLGNTMAVEVTKYFIGTAKDPEIIDVLKKALDLAEFEVKEGKNFFNLTGHPLPKGFSREDVNFEAPALYYDNIIILVKYILAQNAGTVYTNALSEATRSDIRQYYLTNLTRSAQLLDDFVRIMKGKGLFNPMIHLPIPETIEKVHKQSFVGGWLSGDRPLNAEEIVIIVSNFTNIEVEREFLKSFVQVASSKKLKDHFERGQQIAKKHLDIFQSLLTINGLPQLPTWEAEISASTISPFSERLMLFKISLFAATTVGRYGRALATIMRKDIGVDFARLMAEVGLYGEDTLNLMIEFGFLDQLPLAKTKDDRK